MQRLGLIILFSISLFLPPGTGAAESQTLPESTKNNLSPQPQKEPALKETPSQTDTFHIVAERVEIYKKKGEAYFQGNVKATRQDMTVRSQNMRIFYDNMNKKVMKISATGNVIITMQDRQASCDEAIHFPEDQKTYLNGHVVISSGKDKAMGKRAMIDLKNDIQVMEGGVSITGTNDKKDGMNIDEIFGGPSSKKNSQDSAPAQKNSRQPQPGDIP